MQVASLFLRGLDTNFYLPYVLDGEWTEAEKKEIIERFCSVHLPAEVDALFNNWCLRKAYYGFVGRRATWEFGSIQGKTIDEFITKLNKYYTKE